MQEHHRSISASTSRSSLLFALCTFAAGCTDQSVLSGNFEQLPRRFVEPGIMDIPGAPADDQIRVAWRPNGEPYPPIVMGGAGPLQLLPNNWSACEPATCDLRFYAAPVPSEIDAIEWRFAWLTGPGSGSTDNFHFSSDRQRLRVALVTETDHPVLELLFLGDERTAVVHRGGTRVFEGHPDAAGVTITLVPQDGDSWTAVLVAARDGTNGRPLFRGLGTIRTIVAPERSRLIVSVRFTEDEAYRADVSNVSLSLMEMNI